MTQEEWLQSTERALLVEDGGGIDLVVFSALLGLLTSLNCVPRGGSLNIRFLSLPLQSMGT